MSERQDEIAWTPDEIGWAEEECRRGTSVATIALALGRPIAQVEALLVPIRADAMAPATQ